MISNRRHSRQQRSYGRIAKWACELGAHDRDFRPRTTIKTQ
jgi:ribonuclease HI